MKKTISQTVAFILLATLYLMLNTQVSAQYGQYGSPAPSYSILIDKMVQQYPVAASTSQTKGGITTNGNVDCTSVGYVDNLVPADLQSRYRANQYVCFKLRVKNTSNVVFSNVTVKDTLPVYVNAIEGPGSFDATNKVITFDAGSFGPDQEKVFYIKAQLVSSNLMPADKGLFCMINKAQVYAGSAYDDDTAQLCVEKEVVNVTAAPSAGPEMGLALMGLQSAMLGAGVYLKKKSAQV